MNEYSLLSKKRSNEDLIDEEERNNHLKSLKEKVYFSMEIINKLCVVNLNDNIRRIIRNKKTKYIKKLEEITIAKSKIIDSLSLFTNKLKASNNLPKKDNENENPILKNFNEFPYSKLISNFIIKNRSNLYKPSIPVLKYEERYDTKILMNKNELLDYKLKISNGRHLKIFNDTDFKEDKRHLMREKHKLMKFIENNYDTIKNFILIKNKTKITNNF